MPDHARRSRPRRRRCPARRPRTSAGPASRRAPCPAGPAPGASLQLQALRERGRARAAPTPPTSPVTTSSATPRRGRTGSRRAAHAAAGRSRRDTAAASTRITGRPLVTARPHRVPDRPPAAGRLPDPRCRCGLRRAGSSRSSSRSSSSSSSSSASAGSGAGCADPLRAPDRAAGDLRRGRPSAARRAVPARRAPQRPPRGPGPADGDPAGVRVGVERLAHVVQVRRLEVDPDLLDAAVPVGEDELPGRVVGPVVVPRPRREGAEHLLVADPVGTRSSRSASAWASLVVGAADEHRVDQRREPGHPQQVARELRGEQRADVELARVAGEPVDEHLARGHLRQEVGLVQRDALAQVAVGVVDRALGQPRRQVEQLDGERLARRSTPRAGCPAAAASCPAS